MKAIFGVFAAAVIISLTFVQPAEARCFWNGFATICTHHNYYGYGYGPYHRAYDWGYWRGGY